MATVNQQRADFKQKIHIFIELCLDPRPRGFGAYILNNVGMIKIPEEIQHQPFNRYLSTIIETYQHHLKTACVKMNISRIVVGFRYHRHYDFAMESNGDFTLTKIIHY